MRQEKGRAAVVITLTEPELWAVIRAENCIVTPASPLAPLLQAAATLDQLRAAGEQGLAAQQLADGGRVNCVLAAMVRVLCAPQECLALTERGALGTLMRAFYGSDGVYVAHVPLPGSHTLAFPYTRGQVTGIMAATVGLELPGSARRG